MPCVELSVCAQAPDRQGPDRVQTVLRLGIALQPGVAENSLAWHTIVQWYDHIRLLEGLRSKVNTRVFLCFCFIISNLKS